jgi:MFS family permease
MASRSIKTDVKKIRRRFMTQRPRWVLVTLLFVGGMISYLDRAALGYASDRFGPKKVLSISMLVWSLFCGLTAGVFSIASLLVVRVIFGMGEGPYCANINKLVSTWFSRKDQATAIGVANSGQSFGAALAGPIVGFIAVSAGWRMSFVIIAAVGVLWVLAWMAWAKDKPEVAPESGLDARQERAEMQPRAASGVAGTTGAAEPLRVYLLRPAILATAFAFFGYAYILYFFLSWFPSYLTMAHHLSIQKMSVVSVIPWLVGTTGLVAGGFVCDWIYRKTGRAIFARKLVLIVSLAAGAICIAVTGTITDLTSAVALMAVAVFFMYASFNTYFAIILDTVEKRRVGAVSGFVHFIANLAGIAAPAATGFLVQWSGNFKSAFLLTGAQGTTGVRSRTGLSPRLQPPDKR